jgi:hypothetical protein
MDQPEIIVPVAFFFFVIGLPVTIWGLNRVFAHQERMEMIRRGIAPQFPPDPRAFRKSMKYGMWPPPGMPPGSYAPFYDPGYYAQYQLRRGIYVACVGFALLIGLSFIGYRGGGEYIYGPWLLGGLIPLFVGIAQIIGAVLSGARIGNFGPMPPPSYRGPDSQNATTANAHSGVPPSDPYAGWRPGPTPEIEKPPSPPDYRP